MLATIEKTATGYVLLCNGVKLNFRHLYNLVKYCKTMHFHIVHEL